MKLLKKINTLTSKISLPFFLILLILAVLLFLNIFSTDPDIYAWARRSIIVIGGVFICSVFLGTVAFIIGSIYRYYTDGPPPNDLIKKYNIKNDRDANKILNDSSVPTEDKKRISQYKEIVHRHKFF